MIACEINERNEIIRNGTRTNADLADFHGLKKSKKICVNRLYPRSSACHSFRTFKIL